MDSYDISNLNSNHFHIFHVVSDLYNLVLDYNFVYVDVIEIFFLNFCDSPCSRFVVVFVGGY